MHIVNIMFSYIAGGIEQAFVDYCEGLTKRGHRITAITHPDAAINPALDALGIEVIRLRNYNRWDLLAIYRLRKLLEQLQPDIVIAHANRALAMTQGIVKSCPRVGIAQNYTTELLSRADAAFATTHDLIELLKRQGIAPDKLFHIPNMVRCSALPVRQPRNRPPVIGTMGRLVKKKGFDIYIDALALLKARGQQFTAILGGEGEEAKRLQTKAQRAGITDVLSFPGWIEDKQAFYTGIELFCLPSLHEPFGIVLLEAFMYGAPVIATNSEGPRDIITPNVDALIVDIGNAEQLATAMARLLNNPHMGEDLAAHAFAKTMAQYNIDVVAERIEKAIVEIVRVYKQAA